MTEELELIFMEATENMQGAFDHLEKELMNIRAGKASPGMLGGVKVDYYGTETTYTSCEYQFN